MEQASDAEAEPEMVSVGAGESDRPPVEPGRPRVRELGDFAGKCRLNAAGKLFVLRIIQVIEQEGYTLIGVARKIAEKGFTHAPKWAKFELGTTTLDSNAGSMLSKHFGQGAQSLARWGDISLILTTCEVADDARSELASLWMASTSQDPRECSNYKGKFIDVSNEIAKAEDSLRRSNAEEEVSKSSKDDLSTVNVLVQKLEEMAARNAVLQLENDRLMVECNAQRLHIGHLDGRFGVIESLLNLQGARLEDDLRVCNLPVPVKVSPGAPELLIRRIGFMIYALVAGKAAIKNSALELAESRARMAATSAFKLQEALAIERQGNERACHVAATLLTYFAGPAAPKDWCKSEQLQELSLPSELCRLFEPAKISIPRQRDPASLALSFYLGVFLILRHGERLDSLSNELVELIRDGSLPSEEQITKIFGAEEEIERINALQELIKSNHSGLPRRIQFDELNATTVIMSPLSYTA